MEGISLFSKFPGTLFLILELIFSGEAFLVTPSSANTLCLKLDVDKFRFGAACKELFAYREDFCLLHLDTNTIVTLEDDKLGLGYACTDKNKMKLNKDGTITWFFNKNKCIVGCLTAACDLMLSSSPPQQTCILFSFVAGIGALPFSSSFKI